MSKLKILEFPDPRLRTKASPVAELNDSLQKIIDDMFETMYAANGIGLAATQVNFHKRLIVMDVSEDKSSPIVLINPSFKPVEGEKPYEEGCLSVPGFSEEVIRPDIIEITYTDRDGKEITRKSEGLESVCIQHEIDHLNGKLFVDHLGQVKREQIKRKIAKANK